LLVRRLQRLDGEPSADVTTPVLAGLTVALSGAVLRSSQVVMADGLGLGLASAALYCAVRHVDGQRGPWLLGSAVSLAWGAAARWMVGLLALPLAVFLLMHWRAARRPVAVRPGSHGWAWTLTASLAGLAVLIPVLLVALSVPESLAKHEWLVRWDLRNALGRDFHTPDGHATYRLPVALFYLVRLGWHDYFFPIHALFVLAGAWRLLRDRRWATCALLLGWPATAWVFLSGIPYENPRFLLPTLPAIGVLWGIGLGSLRRRAPLTVRRLLVPFIIAAQAMGVAFGAREHARLVAAKNADRDLVAWAAAQMTPGASLLVDGPSLAFHYYASIPARDLFSTSTPELQALLSQSSPVFVLADVSNLETQWVGLAPERNFAALSRNPGLHVIGAHGAYTLFRAGADARE
jgi:hypothetical protein